MGLLDKGTESTSVTKTEITEIINVGDIGFTNDAAVRFVQQVGNTFSQQAGRQDELFNSLVGQVGDEYKQLIGGQNDLLLASVQPRPVQSQQLGLGLQPRDSDEDTPSIFDNKFIIGVAAIGTLVLVLGKRKRGN